jgi:hypothetical protein
MIPEDFIPYIQADGNFAIKALSNGYFEISAKAAGKIALPKEEMKDFLEDDGIYSGNRPENLKYTYFQAARSYRIRAKRRNKSPGLGGISRASWVKHPDCYDPPMSLTLFLSASRRKIGRMEEDKSKKEDRRSSEREFAIGSQWRTRSGGRAIILDSKHSGFIHVWHSDGSIRNQHSNGKLMLEQSSDYDLMEPWGEPMKG